MLSGEPSAIRRIVIEKPFGYDLQSARELNEIYRKSFHEHQLYRIDHFLGKETVQDIMALRLLMVSSSLSGIATTSSVWRSRP